MNTNASGDWGHALVIAAWFRGKVSILRVVQQALRNAAFTTLTLLSGYSVRTDMRNSNSHFPMNIADQFLRRTLSVAAAGALFLLSSTCFAASISDREAGAHVGESVNVEGTVAQVFTSDAGNTFLNFGAAYPRQTFAAVIFKRVGNKFSGAHRWEGKRITVHGVIKIYEGKPEIILNDPDQISE